MQLATRLFFKCLGFCYLVAFLSFGVQASGLLGSQGILPAAEYLHAMRQSYGPAAWWYVPSVLWIRPSDTSLQVVWIAGALAALLLLCDVLRRPVLVLLLALYL